MLEAGDDVPFADLLDFTDEAGPVLAGPVAVVPPDVTQHIPVKHHVPGSDSLISLTTVNGRQVLQHLMTGEAVELPQDEHGLWKLKTTQGFGYLSCSGDEDAWVSGLLEFSVWSVEGRLLVKTETDNGQIAFWYDEMQEKKNTSYASWKASHDYNKPVAHLDVVEFSKPRDGASVFLNLSNLQTSSDFITKFTRSAQWISRIKPKWLEDFADCGLSADHLYRPVVGSTAAGVRLDHHHASVVGVLVIFALSNQNIKTPQDRQACAAIFKGVLENFIGNSFEIPLSDYAEGDDPTTSSYDLAYLKVENWKIQKLNRHWEVHTGDDFFVFFQFILSLRGPARKQFLCKGLLRLAEASAQLMSWPKDPLLCLSGNAGKRAATRHLRAAMLELSVTDSRNAHRTSKLLKRCGFSVPTHKNWADSAYCKKYIFSSRLVLARTCPTASQSTRGAESDGIG